MSDRRSLFVAGLQTAGIPNDLEATLDEFERRVRSLAAMFDGVQLVLAPGKAATTSRRSDRSPSRCCAV